MLRMLEMIGNKKAAVFPEPVWAQAIRSLPSIIIGTACFCTGVGLEYWANCEMEKSSPSTNVASKG